MLSLFFMSILINICVIVNQYASHMGEYDGSCNLQKTVHSVFKNDSDLFETSYLDKHRTYLNRHFYYYYKSIFSLIGKRRKIVSISPCESSYDFLQLWEIIRWPKIYFETSPNHLFSFKLEQYQIDMKIFTDTM